MIGNEKFILNNNKLDFGILDFWIYKYSNIYNMQEVIAEFIVEKALNIEKSYNTDYWTLFDILYRNCRIEIKETSYYHPWNENGKVSNQRSFGITKANSNYENNGSENKFERQNDIYVFCLNTGTTKESSNPMNLNNWEFYIVPTSVINEKCSNNKTISLNKVRQLTKAVSYDNLQESIDYLIDNNFNAIAPEITNSLIDEINKIKSEKWKSIFLDRLNGKTLADIGNKNNLSRERTNKIVNKILSDMNPIKEDTYKDIFEKYFIEKDLFCKLFNEDSIVYYYLNLVYKKGFSTLDELYSSNKLNVMQNRLLKEYLNNTSKKISNSNWNIAFRSFLSQNSLTAKKVAELTGLSKATIDSYMQGKRNPTDQNIQIIKDTLGFDIAQVKYNA